MISGTSLVFASCFCASAIRETRLSKRTISSTVTRRTEMDKEKCGRCKMLDVMNTRNGPRDCCRYFYPPESLDRIECKHTQYGYGILVEPTVKK